MKIVRIIGGLGNQMFQYALYIALKQRFPEDTVLLDTSLIGSYNVHNGLELNRVFGIDLPQANFRQLVKVTRPFYNYKLTRFIEKIFPKRATEIIEAKDYEFCEALFKEGNQYIRGYWQYFKYFDDYKDIIRQCFIFKLSKNQEAQDILNEIQKERDSISIHVRRGDYLKSSIYTGICDLDYYKSAISYISKKIEHPVFYIFSDDTQWCRENIVPLLGHNDFRIVDCNKGKDSAVDMQLMSLCKHNIIAASSFSWWAAYLNKNPGQIVCAPQKWSNTESKVKFQIPTWTLF